MARSPVARFLGIWLSFSRRFSRHRSNHSQSSAHSHPYTLIDVYTSQSHISAPTVVHHLEHSPYVPVSRNHPARPSHSSFPAARRSDLACAMASPRTQTANAIAAIHARGAPKPHLEVPEIDFTQHQLENGEVVSTTERVVKDVSWGYFEWRAVA